MGAKYTHGKGNKHLHTAVNRAGWLQARYD
jgi:hypothetical protein